MASMKKYQRRLFKFKLGLLTLICPISKHKLKKVLVDISQRKRQVKASAFDSSMVWCTGLLFYSWAQ